MSNEDSSYRVVELVAENFKRLKAVRIQPDGDIVVVAGANAQGKTSVLDAIWAALAGKRGVKEITQPIRSGETKASVYVDLGGLRVTRKWGPTSGPTGTLTVTTEKGAKLQRPQEVLDALLGALSFDPLAFANEDPKKQREMLLSVVELPFDPEELDGLRRSKYDERTEVNRELRSLKSRLDSMPPVNAPNEPVDVAELSARINALHRLADRRRDIGRRYEETMAAIRRLEEELRSQRELLQGISEEAGEVGPPDNGEELAALERQLRDVTATNQAVYAKQERARVASELSGVEAVVEMLTEEIAAIDKQKVDGLAAARMPVDGLGFDEDGVLFNGVPFSQASGAERLRVSTALAMALNPDVRVIRISDGSLLDSSNMALLADMAREHDFQLWIERVDESGEVGVVIEDGEVKS